MYDTKQEKKKRKDKTVGGMLPNELIMSLPHEENDLNTYFWMLENSIENL